MPEEKQKIIVAEITKNWYWRNPPSADLLSQRFERVLNVNIARGYILKEWKLTSGINNGIYTETIIAIFELKDASVPDRIKTESIITQPLN